MTAGRDSLRDQLWVPVEIAFAAFGWLVMNAPLVAAAMIPIAPTAFVLWVLWEVSP